MSGRGFHIVLGREDAKTLFGLKEPEAVWAHVQRLVRSPAYQEDGLVVESGTVWDAIHRCLTDGDLDPDGGEFPLNQCVLGGKPLCRQEHRLVNLIRPDIVIYVADALSNLKRDEFSQWYFQLDPASYGRAPSDDEFTEVWIAFKQIRDLFRVAADEHSAVLFAAELPPPMASP